MDINFEECLADGDLSKCKCEAELYDQYIASKLPDYIETGIDYRN